MEGTGVEGRLEGATEPAREVGRGRGRGAVTRTGVATGWGTSWFRSVFTCVQHAHQPHRPSKPTTNATKQPVLQGAPRMAKAWPHLPCQPHVAPPQKPQLKRNMSHWGGFLETAAV